MAITETSICNSALIKIGVETINSLSDNVKAAKLCNQQYSILRDEVLQDHPWNFALARVELANTAVTPVWEFDNEYQLPNDCLKVVSFEDEEFTEYQIEGNKLYTNYDTAKIKYIKRITTTGNFTPKFAEALAFRLAAELAYPLVQSVNLGKAMMQAYGAFLQSARTRDAQEGTPRQYQGDAWVQSRYSPRSI